MVLVQKDFLLFFLLEVYNSMFFYYGRRQHILKRKKKKRVHLAFHCYRSSSSNARLDKPALE